METVLQSIQDYGKGHQPTAATQADSTAQPLAIPDDPQNPNETYQAAIAKIFDEGDFASLEKEAHIITGNKSRLIGGVWKILVFFDGVGVPSQAQGKSAKAYEDHIASVQKWIAEYPESATARLALASSYLSWANAARGNGYANTVSDSAWELHGELTRLALKALMDAAQLKEKSPYWYEALQIVAINQNWDKAAARDLVDHAEAFEPSYYHFYREYANYLLPKWDGEPGDTQAYADEISERLGGADGDIIYFEIASIEACQCDPNRNTMEGYSWAKAQRGYQQLKKLYGVSPIKMNRYSLMAYMERDKTAAKEVFADLGGNMSWDVWSSRENFQTAQAWADTPLP
jgi:hypothetical protein